MMLFSFNKNVPVLIYGYGRLGQSLRGKLLDSGYRVEGVIESHASDMESSDGLRFILPSELDGRFSDCIVVLTFQNLMEHERVAERLAAAGIRKVIGLLRRAKDVSPNSFELFNALVYGKTVFDFDFPYAEEETDASGLYFSKEEDGSVVVEVPVGLVFSGKALFHPGRYVFKERIDERNVSALKEYNASVEMCLTGRCEYPEDFRNYCEMLCGEGRTMQSFLRTRKEAYEMNLEEYRKGGLQFFRATPSLAEWNPEQGYFNMIDGHHRAVFLTHYGSDVIPLRISREDYDAWYNIDSAEKCRDYMEKNGITCVFTPIMHPLFYGMECMTDRRGLVSAAIYRFFCRMDVSAFSVLDVDSCLSYYSRIFIRMGAGRVLSLESRQKEFGLATHLNDLSGIKNIELSPAPLAEANDSTAYDVVVLANDTAPEPGWTDITPELLAKLDRLTAKYLILREPGGCDAEKILNSSGFRKYTTVSTEIVDGILHVIGVYEK